jgi:predicted PurR-regulated permease PerM
LLIIPFIAEQLYIILTSVIAFINDIVIQIDTEGFASFIQSTNIIPTNLKDNVLARANNPNIVANVQNILAGISSGISQYVSTFFSNGGIGAVTQIFTNGLTIIRKITLVLVLSVFFSIEYKSVFIWIVKTVPSDYRTNMYHRMLDLYDKLQLRLKGQAFLMLYIFVISLIGFLVLRAFGIYLPQILLLALFAGMAEFIPYLGPILGGAPAVLLAIVTGGWIAGVIVIIMFRFIQWTENNIVVPVVMNKVLGVRSLVIFLTMVLATRLFGFVGILIAVPLSVIISVFSRPTHTPIQPTKPTSSFRHSTV